MQTLILILATGIFALVPVSAQNDTDDETGRNPLQHDHDRSYGHDHDTCVELLQAFRATVLSSQVKIPGFGGIKMLRYQVEDDEEPFYVEGDISGRLTVEVEVQGFKVITTIVYHQYSDIQGIVLNGPQIGVSNFNGNGSMLGTVRISGKVNGSIGFDDVIIADKKAAGGNYAVTPEGGETMQLSYSVIWPEMEN